MKTTKLLLAAVVSAGLAFALTAQATEEMEEVETVELKSLPAALQKTITEKAAGGEVVRIEKEKEDGKWVYEATVKKGGKEWEFKVDANGKVIKSEEASDDGETGKEKK